jgi:hypothetical protein
VLYILLDRCLRASAQAKKSLEEASEREESCGNSDDCSTISGSSPRNSPVMFAGRKRVPKPTGSDESAAGTERHHLPGGWVADRKDEIVESKGDLSSPILGAKGLADLLSYDSKGVVLDIDSKAVKDISCLAASNKFSDGNQDDKEIVDGPVGAKGVSMSVPSQAGLALSDVVRSSAAIMTAGGAGVDDRAAIICSLEISATSINGDEDPNIDISVPAL